MKPKVGDYVEIIVPTWTDKVIALITEEMKGDRFGYSYMVDCKISNLNAHRRLPIYFKEIVRLVTEDEVALFILSKI